MSLNIPWAFEQKLSPSGSNRANGLFWRSVSMSGDLIVVGAPTSISNTSTSSAYLFSWNGTQWIQETKIIGPPAHFFGRSVSVSGQMALIGAIGIVMIWNFFVNRYWTYNDVE